MCFVSFIQGDLQQPGGADSKGEKFWSFKLFPEFLKKLLCLKVDEAAREAAELILLPEDGIHGYGFTR